MKKKMNVILSIEDNIADRVLVKTAFSTIAGDVSVVGIGDGDSAMNYLRREAPYENAETPRLILLDLNLPGKNGKEILKEIRNDASLAPIPVVVLSGSSALKDIEESYRLGANCYVQKPMGFASFLKLVHSIYDFWVKKVPAKTPCVLPPRL